MSGEYSSNNFVANAYVHLVSYTAGLGTNMQESRTEISSCRLTMCQPVDDLASVVAKCIRMDPKTVARKLLM